MIVVEMPWLGVLTVNHMRFGPGGKYHRVPEVQAWMDRLQWEVYERNWHLDLGGEGQVQVTVDFRFPDRRRRDDHNCHKAIADAVASGLRMDDRDIRIATGSVVVDRERPGFTIRIEKADLGIGDPREEGE